LSRATNARPCAGHLRFDDKGCPGGYKRRVMTAAFIRRLTLANFRSYHAAQIQFDRAGEKRVVDSFVEKV